MQPIQHDLLSYVFPNHHSQLSPNCIFKQRTMIMITSPSLKVTTTSSSYPAAPVFHELKDFCVLLVKLLLQCNNAAENRAITASYPNICKGVLAMQDDLEVAIKEIGQTLVILPDLSKRRKRQLSGIGGFKAPWAGGGAILVEEEGTGTQKRSSSQGENLGGESQGGNPGGGEFQGGNLGNEFEGGSEFQEGNSQRRSSQTEERGGGSEGGSIAEQEGRPQSGTQNQPQGDDGPQTGTKERGSKAVSQGGVSQSGEEGVGKGPPGGNSGGQEGNSLGDQGVPRGENEDREGAVQGGVEGTLGFRSEKQLSGSVTRPVGGNGQQGQASAGGNGPPSNGGSPPSGSGGGGTGGPPNGNGGAPSGGPPSGGDGPPGGAGSAQQTSGGGGPPGGSGGPPGGGGGPKGPNPTETNAKMVKSFCEETGHYWTDALEKYSGWLCVELL